MLSIAIVEDEEGYSKLLQRYIKKYSEETGVQFKIFAYSDGVSFLTDCEKGFNIVLMDIQMPVMDGMRTAKKFRARDTGASIIFVTNMAQYAVEGYEVDALDFIVKPVDYFAFSLKFEKAVRIQNMYENDVTVIETPDEMIKVKTSSITYIESNLHSVIYHTDGGIYKTRSSLKDVEKRFEGKSFVRCGNSFLVNLARVDKITANSVFVKGEELPVSRARKKAFLDAFSAYYR